MRWLLAAALLLGTSCGPHHTGPSGGTGKRDPRTRTRTRASTDPRSNPTVDPDPRVDPRGTAGDTGLAASSGATDGVAGTPPVIRPQPRARRLFFKPQKSTLDLGAPVLALASGDVDGDGVVELVALTSREVVVLTLAKDAATVETRLALPGDLAAVRPRDPVGTLVVADVLGNDAVPEILAHASDRAEGVIVGLQHGTLVVRKTFGEYPLFVARDGAGAAKLATASLGEGVNDFPRESLAVSPAWKEWTPSGVPPRFLTAEATSFLAADGTVHHLAGIVDGDGELVLHALPPADAEPWARLADAGSAFEITDLDADGSPEVITSAYRPPGDGDELIVHTIDEDGTTRVLHRAGALRGGIAAIASGDFDGDGAVDVAALVRLSGATAGDLWVLR